MVGTGFREKLREYERQWRPALGRVSLVAELELTKAEIRTALRCIGGLWNEEHFPDRVGPRVRASYPGSYVVAVAGAASMLAEGRKVWPAIFEAASVSGDQASSPSWGRLFVACLDDLELPSFPELDAEGARRYVSRMLLHGGVPLDHLDEWFAAAERARKNLGDVSRSTMQAWMLERADEGRLYEATKPVERFLRYGGDYAADFLDRSLELLDLVLGDADPDDIRVGLPRRYVERALELREIGLLPGSGTQRSDSRRHVASARPEVHFDPYVLGVHLALPAVTDTDGPLTWLIDLEGDIQRVTVRPPRPGLPTPTAEFPLPSTVSAVKVGRVGQELHELRLIHPSDPHLLFSDDGRRIERTARVDTEQVWSVHPAGRSVATPPQAEPRVLERHESVARWPGWVAELIELTGARSLRLDDGLSFEVASDASASLSAVEPVPTVRAESGHAVLRAWPVLQLPAASRGATWEVSIAALDDESIAVREGYEVGRDGLEVPLRTIVAAQLAWRPVRIRARGPLGRSLRRDVFIAPGLEVNAEPPVRTLQPDGLSPSRVSVSWHGGDIGPITLAPDEEERSVAIESSSLLIAPSAVAVEHVGATSTGWRTHPLRLSTDEVVEDAGSLIVRLPGAETIQLEAVDGHGRTLQQSGPDGRRRADGAARFDLRRFTDTIRAHATVSLVVDSDVWRGLVATVRPARLAGDVKAQPSRGILEFIDVASDGVEAALYRHLAPTLSPVILDLHQGDGQLAIPDELLGAGPLRVLLRVADPWVPSPWPGFAFRDENTWDLLELPADRDVVERLHPLAGYLGGFDGADEIPYHLDDAVLLFEQADHLKATVPSYLVKGVLADVLRSDPSAALESALRAELDGAQLARLLIGSRLITTEIADPLELELVEALWTRFPPAGLLAAGSDVRNGGARTFIARRAGAAAEELLDGKAPDIVGMPRIDMPQLLDVDEAVLTQLRAEAGISPKHLLDPDARADDGFALVRAVRKASGTRQLRPAIRDAEQVISAAFDRLHQHPGLGVLEAGLRRRLEGQGWQLLPAVSLAAATVARLAPRVHSSPRLFNRQVESSLEALARAVPRLVEADLVIAELAIQGAPDA